MRLRTVNVQLELQTDAPLKTLMDKQGWQNMFTNRVNPNLIVSVRQVTASVAQPTKAKAK